MKVLSLVLFFAIAVNNAVSQWRGGVRIDRPPDLPSSSTRQGSRPAGSQPPGSFDLYRRPPPPPRRRDSFDINYFQRRKEPFIPVELHPPVLERPKPTPSPKKKRPKNRKRKGNKSKPWRKNRNDATPPTTEMVTSEYFTTTDAFTTMIDYFTTTTTTAPTTQKATTRAPTTQKPTTTPTTTTPTTTPSYKAPTTKVQYKPEANIVTPSNTIPYEPRVSENKSVNNTQYTVVGAQQSQNKSPETNVSSMSNTNKIPRPPPFTRYRVATPDNQQNDANTVQQQRLNAGQSTTRTQPNESNIYITQQRTIGGPLQPVPSSSVARLGRQNNMNRAQQQINSESYSSQVQPNQPNAIYKTKLPNTGPLTAFSQTLQSKSNGIGLASNQQQQQTHLGSSQNPNQSSGQIASNRANQQQQTNAGSSIAGVKLSQPNDINRVKQLNTGQTTSQTLNQPFEEYRLQQQINARPPSSQSRLSKPNDRINTTPRYRDARPSGTLSGLDQSTDFNRVDQIQTDASSSAENKLGSMNDPNLYSPQRNRPIEIDFRKPVDPKPLNKPVFRFPQASFRRPSDVPTEIRSKVLSRISTGGAYTPTGSSSVEFSSGSNPLSAGQSPSAKTFPRKPLSSNSRGDSRNAMDAVSYSLESSKVEAVGANREPAFLGQASSRLLGSMSKPYGTGIQQQIVAAPELPINRANRNQINTVYDRPMAEPVINSGIFDRDSKVSDVRGADISKKPATEQLPYAEPTRPIPNQGYSSGSSSSFKNLDMVRSTTGNIERPRPPSDSSMDYARKSASVDSQNQQAYVQAPEVVKLITDKQMQQQNPNDVSESNTAKSTPRNLISNNELYAPQQKPRYVSPGSNSYRSSDGINSRLKSLSSIQDSKTMTSESSNSLASSGFLTRQQNPSNVERLDTVKSDSTNLMASVQQQKAIFAPASDTVKSGSIKIMASDGIYGQQQKFGYIPSSDIVKSGSSNLMASDGNYARQQKSSYVTSSDTVNSGSRNVMASDGNYAQQQKSTYVPSSDIVKSGSSNVMASDGIYAQQQKLSNVHSTDIVKSGSSNVMASDRINRPQQNPSYDSASDKFNTGSSYSMQSEPVSNHRSSETSETGSSNTIPNDQVYPRQKNPNYAQETVQIRDSNVVNGVSNTRLQNFDYAQDAVNSVVGKTKTSESNPQQQKHNLITEAVDLRPTNVVQQKPNYATETLNSGLGNTMESGAYSGQQKPNFAKDTSNLGTGNAMLSGTYSEQQKTNFATDTLNLGSGNAIQSGAYSDRQKSNFATYTANIVLGNTNLAADTANLGLGRTIQSGTYPQQQKTNIATESLNLSTSSNSKSGISSQPRKSNLAKDTANYGSNKSVPNPSESKSQQSDPVYMLGTDNINVESDVSTKNGVNPPKQQSGNTQISNPVDSIASKTMKSGSQPKQQSALSKDQYNAGKPIVDLNKPPQQSVVYPKSSDLSQNKASSTNNNSDKPTTKTFTDTQALSENTKTSLPSERTVETQPAASSSPNTKVSRVQKVGKMMLKVFNDFMAKYRGASSTKSESKPTKVSSGQQTEKKPVPPEVGKANPITSFSNSMQNENVTNHAAHARIPKARDEFAIQSASDSTRVSNFISNEGTERQVSNGGSGQSQSTNQSPNQAYSSIPVPSNDLSGQETNGNPGPIVGELRPTPTSVQYTGNNGQSGKSQVTNGVQTSVGQDVYPVVGNVAKQASIRNNSPYEAPSSGSNNNIGYKLPSTTLQPRPFSIAETKVVSGPPPPSFRRGKPPTARNNAQPANGVIGNVNTNQKNVDPLNVPVDAHPAVLTRPPKVFNTQGGNIAQQGSAYPDPAPQGSQEVYNQHQTVGGRLGPAPCKMAPVCASDGFTYMSNCFLWAGLTIVCEGYCPCPGQPAATQPGQQGTLSHLLPYDAGPEVQAPAGPQPLCSSCPSTFNPVCTTTGATYDNDCLRRCNGEALACNGECPCPSSATSAQPCENHCQATIAPVCSVWDHTFDNDCLRLCSGEAKACNGECPCPGSQVPNGVVAQETAPGYQGNVNNEPSNQPLSTCECLAGDVDPVCTTSGETLWFGCKAICLGAEIACSSNCPC